MNVKRGSVVYVLVSKTDSSRVRSHHQVRGDSKIHNERRKLHTARWIFSRPPWFERCGAVGVTDPQQRRPTGRCARLESKWSWTDSPGRVQRSFIFHRASWNHFNLMRPHISRKRSARASHRYTRLLVNLSWELIKIQSITVCCFFYFIFLIHIRYGYRTTWSRYWYLLVFCPSFFVTSAHRRDHAANRVA